MPRRDRLSGWDHLSAEQDAICASISTVDFPTGLDLWSGVTIPRRAMHTATYTALTLIGGSDPFEGNEKILPETVNRYRIQYDAHARRSSILPDIYPSTAPPPNGPLRNAHQAIAQLASFHPSQRGLQPKIAFPHSNPDGLQHTLRSLFAAGLPLGGTVHDGIFGTIHPAWMTGLYGWFPAGADIHRFGTPFLAMQIVGNSHGGQRWGLYLNGLPYPTQIAPYLNEERLTALERRLHTVEIDDALIMYALQHGMSAVRDAKQAFDDFRTAPYPRRQLQQAG